MKAMRPVNAAPAATKPTKAPKAAAPAGAEKTFAATNPTVIGQDGKLILAKVALVDKTGAPKVDAKGQPITRVMPPRLRRTDFTKDREGRKLYFRFLGLSYIWRSEQSTGGGPKSEEEKLESKKARLLRQLEELNAQKAALDKARAGK